MFGLNKGAYVYVWLLLAVILVLIPRCRSTLPAEGAEAITSGLESTAETFNIISDGDFKHALLAINKNLGPMMLAVGPVIGFVLEFIQGDSEELAFMKEMLEKIENRFDKMDTRFDNVERLIDWTDVAVNFGQVEQKIMALNAVYRYLFKSIGSNKNKTAHKNLFIKAYESNYELSGLRLYQGVMTTGTFQQNLGDSIIRFLKYDRAKTQQFLLGVLDLLFQSIELELAYLHVQGIADVAEHARLSWEKRMKKVEAKFTAIDLEVRDKYSDQSLTDIKQYAADNAGDDITNSDFGRGIYEMLKTKYNWRDWLVVVYNPITGSNNHYVQSCGGHVLFRQNGRNIIVASIKGDAPPMDKDKATSGLREIGRSVIAQAQKVDRTWYLSSKWKADLVYTMLKQAIERQSVYLRMAKKAPFESCSFGAIKGGNDAYVISEPDRFVEHDAMDYYKLFFFGSAEQN